MIFLLRSSARQGVDSPSTMRASRAARAACSLVSGVEKLKPWPCDGRRGERRGAQQRHEDPARGHGDGRRLGGAVGSRRAYAIGARKSNGAGPAARSQPDAFRLHLGDEPRRDLRRERADVVLVLEQHAERVGRPSADRARRGRARPAPRPSRASRRRPGALKRSIARSRCTNATISRASDSRRLRALAAQDRELARARRDSRPSGRGSGA